MYIERLHGDKLLLRLSTQGLGYQNLSRNDYPGKRKDKKIVWTKASKGKEPVSLYIVLFYLY